MEPKNHHGTQGGQKDQRCLNAQHEYNQMGLDFQSGGIYSKRHSKLFSEGLAVLNSEELQLRHPQLAIEQNMTKKNPIEMYEKINIYWKNRKILQKIKN